MINFSDNYLKAKNEIATGYSWIRLIELEYTAGQFFRFTDNNEDVVYNGFNYSANLPFNIDIKQETSKGNIAEYKIQVSNINRSLIPYLKQYDGFRGCKLNVLIVRSDLLGEVAPIIETYEIIDSEYNFEFITLTIGKENIMLKQVPKRKYLKNFCNFEFKGVECGYAGTDTTCNKTLADCQAKGNQARFGGYPSIPFGTVIKL